MLKLKKLILPVLALAAIAANAQEIKEYKFNVGPFNKMSVYDNINVVYSCNPDSTGYAYYRAAEDANPFLLTVKGNRLKIQADPFRDLDAEVPTIYVYSDFLTDITNNSDGRVEVNALAPCAEFNATQVGNGTLIVDGIKSTEVKGKLATGNGSVILIGKCAKASFSMVGTGLIQADELKANEVKCTIGGTGTIGCYATDKLHIGGMGTTSIYVKGNPQIIKKSLGGKIVKINLED